MAISSTGRPIPPSRDEIIDDLQCALRDQKAGQEEIRAAEHQIEEAGEEVDRCLDELTELDDFPLSQDVTPQKNQIADRLQAAIKNQVAGQKQIKAAEDKISLAKSEVEQCLKKLYHL